MVRRRLNRLHQRSCVRRFSDLFPFVSFLTWQSALWRGPLATLVVMRSTRDYVEFDIRGYASARIVFIRFNRKYYW